ncbi:hypothetical protein DN398_20715 [Bacillus sp. JAS102]|nr:hypothetical protein DN398_20715 [Bacillus sp. JAS102]
MIGGFNMNGSVSAINSEVEIIIQKLVRKLSNPELVEFEFERKNLQPWNPLSLSHGYPGLIILFSEMDRYYPDKNFDNVAHQYMIKLRDLLETADIQGNVSLFNGFSGINYTVLLASKEGTRYSSMLNTLDDHLYKLANSFMEQVEKKHEDLPFGSFEFCYDLVMGITGIGRYALESRHPGMKKLLERILTHLVHLATEKLVEGEKVTNFFSPPETIIVEEDKLRFTSGYMNLGLSHGIAGPLALLSLAITKGIVVKGQSQAIDILFQTLHRMASKDGYGYYFKRMLGLEDILNGVSCNKEEDGRFDAWCYGSFGIARALSLAYEALEREEMKEMTSELLYSLVTVPVEKMNVKSSILCHGYGGNMQILNRLSHSKVIQEDCKLRNLLEKRKTELLKVLINQFDSKSEYGFYDVIYQNNSFKREEKIGFLEGVAGVLLSLVSCIKSQEARWDEILLLG